ncbi:MAG: transcription antitermination factor NusB [Eubacteriales bacterium]|nr:transcription antitermination factor NusB [Eubacteriales bacterium]MDD3882236.1 transcription antitermination factor NusB [Eubacteriales bacterium]MDD4512585.1 transcription antitermination factor NusB [Eubacteriales bacterium]
MGRSLARCTAMQLIYEAMMGGEGGNETLCGLLNVNPNDDDTAYIESMLSGVRDNQTEIDGIISKFSRNWTIDRIAKVDLAILRLALYEIIYCPAVPDNVSVSEACNLADIYSDAESKAYINGLLGAFLRERGE